MIPGSSTAQFILVFDDHVVGKININQPSMACCLMTADGYRCSC